MTKKEKLLLVIGIIFAPVLALIATIFRALSLFTELDKATGYFTPPAFLNTAFFCVAGVAVLLFFVFSLICRKRFTPPTYRNSLSIFFSSAFFIVTMAVATLLAFFSVPTAATTLTKAFWIIAAISSLLSLVYFSFFFTREQAHGSAHGLLGLAPSFFCLFTAMLFYFDRTMQMNNPAKLLHLLAFLLLACYFTAESRGILAEAKPAFYYFLAAAAMLFSSAAAIPNLLYNLMEGKALVLASVYDFVLLAAMLYTLARLLQLLPYECPLVHRMVQIFLRRAQEEAEEAAAEMEEDTESEDSSLAIEELLQTQESTTETKSTEQTN